MAEAERPLRLILHDFLPRHLCKELEFIHKSCCTVGYRPNVFSTTLSHLIATNCSHLVLPFVSIRDRVKDKVEEFFGCEYELFIEFTGLISWTKGASIGWHSDDNRSYLKQRDFAAVCYLNSHGKDFKGGLFHFQDGEPTTVVPVAGDVVMYTADSCNIHSVDEIADGERLTLTLWFTRDSSYDEDAKFISLLSQNLSSNSLDEKPLSFLPLPAPSNMYWFSQNQGSQHQSGYDIRWARICILGYTLYARDNSNYDLTPDSSFDLSELLMEPLWLARENAIFNKEFVNGLHALQVVQFYCWKSTELRVTNVSKESGNVIDLSLFLTDKCSNLKLMLLGDQQLVNTVFHHGSSDQEMQPSFSWDDFSAVVAAWEDYTHRLRRELITSLPHWKTHESIFTVPALGLQQEDVPTSPIFNVSDISMFNGDPPEATDVPAVSSVNATKGEDLIEDVVDVKTTKTRGGILRRYLVRWKDRPLTECSWMDEKELRRRREDLFQRLSEAFSTESSSSHMGGADVA